MAYIHRIVTKTGSVLFQARWSERDSAGKRLQKARNFDNRSDAKIFAQRMETEAERKGITDLKLTVAQYLNGWLARLVDQGQLSPTTLSGYRRCLDKALPDIGHLPLTQITPRHFDDLYAKLAKSGGRPKGKAKDRSGTKPLAGRTLLHIHRCLHVAFKQAKRWKYVADNPVSDAQAPRAEKSRVRAFSQAEIDKLMRTAEKDRELLAIISTLLVTGMRRSELLGLSFGDCDFEAQTVSVNRVVLEVDHQPIIRERTKSQSSARTIAVPTELISLLLEQRARVLVLAQQWGREYERDPLLVFPGMAGRPMLPQRLTDRLTYLLQCAGITDAAPVHSWRHTSATSLYHATLNPKIVQHHLGHASIAFTLATYVKPLEADRSAADHFAGILKRRNGP